MDISWNKDLILINFNHILNYFQWQKLVHEIAHYHNRNHKTLRKSHNGLRPKFAVTKKGTKPIDSTTPKCTFTVSIDEAAV